MKKLTLRTILSTLVLASLVTGCGETSLPVATGDADIRGINAIVEYSDVDFLIEESPIGSVNFKSITAANYDDLSYTFNFDLPQVGAVPDRIASRSLDVIADTDYVFVLTGDVTSQEATLWQRPLREWNESESVFDIMAGHANNALGEVDVYLAPDGTAPVAGNALGSISFRNQIDPQEFEAGEYQITLTPAGDPSTILYRSLPTTFPAAASYLITVFETDPAISGPVSVRVYAGGNAASELPDERFPAITQFVNGSIDTGAVDIAIDADYMNLAVANLGFAEVSDDVEIPETANIQYAPAGTTMAVLEQDLNAGIGGTSLQILTSNDSGLLTLQFAGFRRGFSTVGRVRVTNAVTTLDNVDVYLIEAGASVEDNFPTLFNFPFGSSQIIDRGADSYEISVTEAITNNLIAGPEPLDLDVFDVVEVVLLDSTDPGGVQILTFSNVEP